MPSDQSGDGGIQQEGEVLTPEVTSEQLEETWGCWREP